jgi:hypothetical protein
MSLLRSCYDELDPAGGVSDEREFVPTVIRCRSYGADPFFMPRGYKDVAPTELTGSLCREATKMSLYRAATIKWILRDGFRTSGSSSLP